MVLPDARNWIEALQGKGTDFFDTDRLKNRSPADAVGQADLFRKLRSDISSLDRLIDFLKCAAMARGEPSDEWEFKRRQHE
ncbi:hypothetical protein [Bradyrhizobium arachidis]|uniref:hypothetical protein n=1 Tax=Bradyrhizobium arachidis TaxID=858423 RepID=UPI00116023B1|nr:hypothetical protein [Bradyrhizobium arachidis]